MKFAIKILDLPNLLKDRRRFREQGGSVVFTNGCFDVIHAGHIRFLTQARELGECLVVGLNSDASVTRLKGAGRPINRQADRALVIAALEMVDYVTIFDADEPARLIEDLLPDVLVKGSDWQHYVSGREAVERNGGKVVLIDLVAGYSSSAAIARMKAAES